MVQNSNSTDVTLILYYSLYFIQTLICAYFLTSVILFLNIIRDIHFHLKQKRSILNSFRFSANREGFKYKLAYVKKCLVSSTIIFWFFFFESCFCIFTLSYGVYSKATTQYLHPKSIQLDSNCSLAADSYLARHYDTRFHAICLSVLSSFRDSAFSMMFWLFTAYLLHSSFVTSSKLRGLLGFIFTGITVILTSTVLSIVPSTSLLAPILMNLLDNTSFLFALYSVRNLSYLSPPNPYNTNNLCNDRSYQRRIKMIVLILFCLETYTLNNTVLFIPYTILNSVSLNSCWFEVMCHFKEFELSHDLIHRLSNLNNYLLAIHGFIEMFVYLNFAIISLVLIWKFCSFPYKGQSCSRKMQSFHGLSKPLLSHSDYNGNY